MLEHNRRIVRSDSGSVLPVTVPRTGVYALVDSVYPAIADARPQGARSDGELVRGGGQRIRTRCSCVSETIDGSPARLLARARFAPPRCVGTAWLALVRPFRASLRIRGSGTARSRQAVVHGPDDPW